MSGIRTKMVLKKQQVWVYAIAVLFVVDFVFYGYLPSHRRRDKIGNLIGFQILRI